MRHLPIALLIALAFLPAEKSAAEPRILSGAPVQGDTFQSTVALVSKNKPYSYLGHFCGGTLIRPRWVLTAAHCVQYGGRRNIDIVSGRPDLSARGGERIAVSGVRLHPLYKTTAEEASYDFALLRQGM